MSQSEEQYSISRAWDFEGRVSMLSVNVKCRAVSGGE